MKKSVLALVAALATACAVAQDGTRNAERPRGERRAGLERPMMPGPMMGGGAFVMRMLSSKMALERIGVTDAAQSQKIIDAIKPLREESDKLDGKIRELTRAQSQAMRELLKDKSADPKAAAEKVAELEKLRAEQGRLTVKAVVVLRDNLTPEQAEKVGEMLFNRGFGRGMRPGMGPGGERRGPRADGEGPRRRPRPSEKRD